MIKVSVIIPTYNREGTLSAAIKSALEQSFPVHEVLVCDDGSTDNSQELVLSFKDERLKWIAGQHAGLPAVPRNRGIKASTGNWLAFLDSDDTWHREKIQTQKKIIEGLKCKAVCSNALRIVNGKNPEVYFTERSSILTFEDLIKTNKVICSSALIDKSIISKIGFFPEEIRFKAIEDYSYWLKTATHTNWGYSDEALITYYDDPQNSVRSDVKSEYEQKSAILEEYLNWNNNPDSLEFKIAKKTLENFVKQKRFRIIDQLKFIFYN